METIHESDTLEEAADILVRTHRHGLFVLNEIGNLTGVLTVQDIDKVKESERVATTVGQVCTHELLVAYPHETLNDALLRMSHRDVGRLPVVDQNSPRKLVGVLRRADVIHAYEIALTRRTTQRHRAREVRLDAFTPAQVNVLDVTIEKGAPCADKKMSETPWPHDSLIASVRRGSQVFIPHGDTILNPGDIIVVVAEGKARQDVLNLCRRPEEL